MKKSRVQKLRLQPISAAASGPLYRQIAEGIKREISEGRLEAGAALPSFRALGKNLNVSLITVKRAYEELAHEGIIDRKQGLGTFVSHDGAARSRSIKRKHTETLLRRALQEGIEAGLSPDELRKMADRFLPDDRNTAKSVRRKSRKATTQT
ncbi:MAG: GntR family transcriptional regulator [Candidatus Hydrogenedentes bacterium]|nr:GntR family transcriptional regulator [Candidatus Hydrogenedentota bacterium]